MFSSHFKGNTPQGAKSLSASLTRLLLEASLLQKVEAPRNQVLGEKIGYSFCYKRSYDELLNLAEVPI